MATDKILGIFPTTEPDPKDYQDRTNQYVRDRQRWRQLQLLTGRGGLPEPIPDAELPVPGLPTGNLANPRD